MSQHEPGGARPRSRHRFTAAVSAAVFLISACSASPGAGASTGASGGAAGAGDYPNRLINMVVPFAAGGPTDTVTRLIAAPMSASMGQQIVVQNVAGAGGTLAAGQVATAAPDGYTVLMHHIGMATAPTLYKNLAFAPLTAFEPVGLVTEVPMTIIGAKDFAPKTLQELVAYVKKNGAAVKYANAGIGAASHLCGLLFQTAVGAKVTEVPYDGTGPAMTDLLGGQVDFMCDQTTNTTKQIQAGTVQAYAVTTPARNEAMPNVPTTKEAGLEGMDVTVWHGLYVPAGTPQGIVQKLSDELRKALKDPEVITRFKALGTTPVADDQATPAAHRAKLKSQIELWKPIIEAAGVSAG